MGLASKAACAPPPPPPNPSTRTPHQRPPPPHTHLVNLVALRLLLAQPPPLGPLPLAPPPLAARLAAPALAWRGWRLWIGETGVVKWSAEVGGGGGASCMRCLHPALCTSCTQPHACTPRLHLRLHPFAHALALTLLSSLPCACSSRARRRASVSHPSRSSTKL